MMKNRGQRPNYSGYQRNRALSPILWVIGLCLWLSPAVSFAQTQELPFSPGEKITYAIKKLGVTVGEATLTFNGAAQINGRDALLITFTAASLKFFDEEKIYVDAQTFYPIVVERNIDLFGKKEVIRENYGKDTGVVKVVKEVDGKTEETVIRHESLIENIYGFIYRYRAYGAFREGESFSVQLPTSLAEVEFVGEADLEIDGQTYRAYYAQGTPKDIAVWFEVNEAKTPLRIDGALKLGRTSLVMTSYVSD